MVDKNVIYSDTLKPVEDIQNNIYVSSIFPLSKYSLDTCIEVITEANEEVEFYNIVYSKEKRAVYFVTNKKISIKEWHEFNIFPSKAISAKKEILAELRSVLSNSDEGYSNSVSLYDIALLIKKMEYEYFKVKHTFNGRFNKVVKSAYGDDSGFIVYDFDYNKNGLRTGFKRFKKYSEITFSKKDDDLYVLNSETYYSDKILSLLGKELSKLYDGLEYYKKFRKESCYCIKTMNSNLGVNINCNGIEIYTLNNGDLFDHAFKLISYSYKDEYECKCNSNFVNNICHKNEDKIFKNIYIRIDDCPEWCKDILYELRQKQLSSRKKRKQKKLKKEKK